jgi:galactokinase
MSAALALTALFGSSLDIVELARIGQHAENEYVGAMTGLLDQITSLSGKKNAAVLTDFRSLEIASVDVPDELVLLAIDTGVKHSLGESAYNDRRSDCESAVTRLNDLLPRRISSLRDIAVEEFSRIRDNLDPRVARRAEHVIGENARVLEAVGRLRANEVDRFGELMYASHESSKHNFENSCVELDWIVDACQKLKWVYGARLSGGGFGGNAVVLVLKRNADRTIEILEKGFGDTFGSRCSARKIVVSDGARVID